ncbi:MAG: hypothetical protein NTY15_08510 [Planctomycetota bacterium]|nr:hypothetical protein [Planctomycetota bacterium]
MFPSNFLPIFAATAIAFAIAIQSGAAQEVSDFTGGMPTMDPPGTNVAFRTIIVRPKIAVGSTASKLFPTQERLQHGNAAPIILRQNFEATQRQEALRKFYAKDYLSMPLKSLDAEEIIKLTPIGFGDLSRAAFRERAGWEYPIGEGTQPLMSVLLPDVQETRIYAKAIAVRARVDLREGRVDEALDKLSIGLGLSKHVGETPFQVCKLVQSANATNIIGVIEELIQHPASENQYWNIAGVPSPFVDTKPALQLEAFMWPKSILQLADLDSISTESQWQSLVKKIMTYSDLGELSEASVFEGWTSLARERLPAIWKNEERPVQSMSDSEVWVRYWHMRTQMLTDECMSWGLLDFHHAIPMLIELRERREKELADELPVKIAFEPPLKLVIAAASLQQHLRMIQTIESIRDWSGKNGGLLPKTLQDLELPAPLDCVVNKPFVYLLSADGKTASLSSAVVENRGFRYELELE